VTSPAGTSRAKATARRRSRELPEGLARRRASSRSRRRRCLRIRMGERR
jgi:hypothetical protein